MCRGCLRLCLGNPPSHVISNFAGDHSRGDVVSHGGHLTCGVVEEKWEDLLAERQREAVEVAVTRVVLRLVHPWRPVKVSSSDLRPIPFLY